MLLWLILQTMKYSVYLFTLFYYTIINYYNYLNQYLPTFIKYKFNIFTKIDYIAKIMRLIMKYINIYFNNQ